MSTYNLNFYQARHQQTNKAAEIILSQTLEVIGPINAAIDIGCGVGTWLAYLKSLGCSRILGIDGDWVNKDLLEIPPEMFFPKDLEHPLNINETFDLAISLEVAEHLSKERASGFVSELTHLSPFVLFSAAVPFQGGRNHCNPRWQDYWIEKFKEHGYYAFDCIRPVIWEESEIPTWYRQNIFLFIRQGYWTGCEQIECKTNLPTRVIHPDLYYYNMKKMHLHNSVLGQVRKNLKRNYRSVKQLLKKILPR